MHDEPTEESGDGIERERWINEVLKDRLTSQLQSFERLETKAGVVLGLLTIAAPFLAQHHHYAHQILMYFAFGCYAVTGIAAIAVIAPRKIDTPPEPETFVRDVRRTSSFAKAQRQLVDTRVTSFNTNKERGKHKAMYWFASFGTFVIGTVFATVSLAIRS